MKKKALSFFRLLNLNNSRHKAPKTPSIARSYPTRTRRNFSRKTPFARAIVPIFKILRAFVPLWLKFMNNPGEGSQQHQQYTAFGF